ncbi:MFS transporter [Candidatus Puniceispirillum marinum]|uniref:Putative major facilitator family (MFS) transporter n=1 Tax=Puniceispirillum marinum (strain IMCC1322) TaxID=488538 RepID=D5BRT2_PUNMI|nr:MFS transporter [Candidatus Puniceispirillum marinum]ADE38979.1 putative major facilitator family (MFS) transporter [Candidatus Puniceispirillum marinum IMCC1322]
MGTVAQTSLVMIFGLFLAISFGFGLDLVSAFLPDIQAEIGFDYNYLGLLTAGGKIGLIIGGVTCYLLAPLFGNCRLVVLAVALTGLSLIGLGYAEQPWMVGLCMFLAGFATIVSWAPMVGVFARFISKAHMGKAFGAVGTGAGIGTFASGSIAPYFINNFDWRAGVITVGLGCLIFVGLSAVYLWHMNILEKKISASIAPQDLQSKSVSLGTLLSRDVMMLWCLLFFVGFTMQPFQNYLSPFIRDELQYSAEIARDAWVAMGATGLFAGIVMGMASDRFGIGNVIIVALACLIAANVFLILHHDTLYFIGAGIGFGLCFYSVPALIPTYIGKVYDAVLATQIFAGGNIMLGIGAVFGNVFGGVTKEYLGTFKIYYISAIMAVFVMMVLCYFVMCRQRPKARAV